MKTKTTVHAGGLRMNHNRHLKVRKLPATSVRRVRGLGVRTGVTAGVKKHIGNVKYNDFA